MLVELGYANEEIRVVTSELHHGVTAPVAPTSGRREEGVVLAVEPRSDEEARLLRPGGRRAAHWRSSGAEFRGRHASSGGASSSRSAWMSRAAAASALASRALSTTLQR